MGFMGYIYRALGFESEQPKIKAKPAKTKASYKFKNGKAVNRAEHIDGIPVYYPENFSQSREYADFLKDGKALIISTEYCGSVDSRRLLDYYSGFACGINAKFIILEEDKLYLLLPEGMEVEE